MTKVLFCDFDGVLNSAVWKCGLSPDYGGVMLSEYLIGNLNTVIKHTEADLVLSTDWRRHWSQFDLKATLYDLGFIGNIIGMTPELNKVEEAAIYSHGKVNCEKERVLEINVWLDKNPMVDRWIAIDDMDLTKGDISDSNFVKTSFSLGLVGDSISEAIRKLDGEIHL